MTTVDSAARRWSSDDELGAANFLTREGTIEALALAREGTVYDLSWSISEDAPRLPKLMSPYTLCMWSHPLVARDWYERNGAVNGIGFADERVEMDLHTGTHVDALGHVCNGDAMYNGLAVRDVVTNRGLARLGIEKMPPVVTRGVLLDVPAALGRELRPSEALGPDVLAATLETQGTELRTGDLALIRTGWSRYYEADNAQYVSAAPGIDEAGAAWLAERKIVAVGSDTMVLEVFPEQDPARPYPVHQLLLVELGVYIVENVVLEELAAARVHEFLCLCLAPKFRGGTGSPVRLVAVA